MTAEGLLKDVRRVGMSTLVRYYKYFANEVYANAQIKDLMRRENDYKENSLNTKVSTGIKIVRRDGYGKEALRMVAESGNVDEETRDMARDLLQCTVLSLQTHPPVP